MFENLSDKLQDTIRNLRGRGKLTEENIEEAMREVRLALLDADVNFKIVKGFVERVKVECLGDKVLKSITPGQQFVKVVSDELTALMGNANEPLELKGAPAVILMCGLHGSGKTTTSAKLAAYLKSKGKHPMLVAADIYRPAAIDQLEFLGQQLSVPVYSDRNNKDVTAIAAAARAKARASNIDVMILDTAGRLQIDEELMAELVKLKKAAEPSEVLFVADSAIGQEAVNVATHFHEALGITGVVLTKLDGDARGGAALSIREVTGKPIKFIGVGEKIEDLEPFYPDRMANRILGMGDVVSLVEKAQEAITEKEARELEDKLIKKTFDLEDFRNQLGQLKKLGGMRKMLSFIPGGNNILKGADIDEGALVHIEAIIGSMTPYERTHPEVLGVMSRRQRISRGCGRTLLEVNQLIKRFETMRGMMSKFGKMTRAMNTAGAEATPSTAAAALRHATAGTRPLTQKEKKAMRKKGKSKGGKRKK